MLSTAKMVLRKGTRCDLRRRRVLILILHHLKDETETLFFYDPVLAIWKASDHHNDYCYTLDSPPIAPNLSVTSMAKAWGSGDSGSGSWLLTCVWADRWHRFGPVHGGAGRPRLFFAALSVVGDREQLMNRKASQLKRAPACGEQKVFTTHEFAEKGSGQHGGLDLGVHVTELLS